MGSCVCESLVQVYSAFPGVLLYIWLGLYSKCNPIGHKSDADSGHCKTSAESEYTFLDKARTGWNSTRQTGTGTVQQTEGGRKRTASRYTDRACNVPLQNLASIASGSLSVPGVASSFEISLLHGTGGPFFSAVADKAIYTGASPI